MPSSGPSAMPTLTASGTPSSMTSSASLSIVSLSPIDEILFEVEQQSYINQLQLIT
jgi:hypothetical protein